ncbi:MAG: PqqD family protein [Actinomycetota bacterium]
MAELRLRQADLQWRSVEGEVVALDVSGSQYLGVNSSGAALWDLLAAGTTRVALVDHLAGSNGLDEETAQAHVDAFLAQLRAQDLIEEGE